MRRSQWDAICSRGDLAGGPDGCCECPRPNPNPTLTPRPRTLTAIQRHPRTLPLTDTDDNTAGTAADWPQRRSWAINGPTTGDVPPGGSLPPFSWAQFNSTSHVGLPEVYDFAYEAMVPDSEVWPITA